MQSLTKILSLVIVTMVLLSKSTIANVRRRGDTTITIFADAEFAGNSATIDVSKSGCTSVPTNLNDKITSISFNSTNIIPNCVFGFTEFKCLGTRFMFRDSTICLNNLAAAPCNSDNTISSFKSCEVKDFVGRN